MSQVCCLNPDCHNPPVAEGTKYCPNCDVTLIILRNRYRPVKPLGGGGFGKTYLAEDIDKLNERCVIKQLAPQTQSTYALKKAKELFEQEAKQLKDLKSSQIPQLQAYFDQDNCLYLIQEFIDGEDLLKELKNQGNFSEQKIRSLLQDLLPVLQVVHDQDIIHRDIKPENIMRRRDGKLFLIDFGASKQLQGTMKPGTKIGTFGYAALEQMEDREVYPASDLFSLAATCFHLLTGVYPGNLWNRQGYSWVKQWRDHLPQPVSLELGKILDKLLDIEYQNRYQTAEQVLQALQPVQPIQPPKIPTTILPQPTPLPVPARKTRPVQPIVQTNSSRRGFLQTVGLFVGGVTVAVVGQNIFGNKNQNSTPTNTTSTDTPTTKNTTTPTNTTPTDTPSRQTPTNNLQTSTFEVVTTDASGNITNRRNESANYFVEDLGNGVTLAMVEIPGGTFIMGSPASEAERFSDEGPQRQVTVPGFFMARYQLTQAQYQAIMGKNPSNFKGDNRPVEQVSWNDAVEFCEKLSQKTGKNYSLPSEAQWEYACRAGTTTPFYFGESITTDLVNYDGNYTYANAPKGEYRKQTTEVGTFPPNAFGLYDMHGNVYEWCKDLWNDNYNGAPTDGSAWLTGDNTYRLLRGGSWYINPGYCRSARRDRYGRDYGGNGIGFRLVASSRTS
ncbi:bifunctional serine/threonine-protein kinase/formylglycine-generating enzyme family protein [Cronbergia sp. UHCC 0137]|uniref:bifunctional serine/threonine-protein kinase/formylglycine-generating enzyme family protein n=1 Tax=Cronbergia sp. UHCC 0137 TaxID=3110239 RepID=UPI002B1FF7DC|nr:bifunctional serine/threonine-protein kinase/formylglycine-generating enzyme family protein [Cronbergia sp. UHCC 0137]MEA5621093.1 bifunctional serine/threonine-protein kinase/formylglycine-generating enzyme family protein [Cronbergia sp. UHCC 0137]